MVVHNETSTGVTSRIADVRAAMGDHDALLLVDTISSLGSIDYRHDEWGVDVTVGGSQKGLMLPAGLSFNAVSREGARGVQDGAAAALVLGLDADRRRQPRPASGPTRARRTCSTGCARRSRCCARKGSRTCSRATRATPTATRAAVHGWGLEVLALDEREFSGR